MVASIIKYCQGTCVQYDHRSLFYTTAFVKRHVTLMNNFLSNIAHYALSEGSVFLPLNKDIQRRVVVQKNRID